MNCLCLLIVLGVYAGVQGFVMHAGEAKMEIGANGPIFYCEEYETLKRWSSGEKQRDTALCMDCECSHDGLICTGIGYATGVQDRPGCNKRNKANCCYDFVKADNADELCDGTEETCPSPIEN